MFSPKVDVCQLNLCGYFVLENNDLVCFKLCVPFHVYVYHIKISTSYLYSSLHHSLFFISIHVNNNLK